MNKFERWKIAWKELGIDSGAEEVFKRLIKSYSSTYRAYHTLAHVRDCLVQFDLVKGYAKSPSELETAIWFHDAIYDVTSNDNEERSAQMATEILNEFNAPKPVVSRIVDLILATRPSYDPVDVDEKLIVDIDLSILGSLPAKFNTYEEQIRQEYQWSPEEMYQKGRAEFIRSMLEKDTIFNVEIFKLPYN